MKRWLLSLLLVTVILVSLGTGMFAGIVLDREVLTPWPQKAAPAAAAGGPDYKLIGEAWNIIRQDYVDKEALKPQDLTYGAIAGMVAALGDTGHSRFLSPEMLKQEESTTQGHFEGIGVEVQMKDGHLVIVAPLDGSPAQAAGLHPGDIILQVDGVDISGLTLSQVVSRILGPAGTSVRLTILSPGTGRTADVTLVRARITVHNVTWQMVPGTTVAHVRIAAFSQGVTAELKQALTSARQQGATAVVLDLRSNPGGVLDEAVGTASQFLASGNVLLEKDAQGKETPVAVQPKGVATDLPLAVLTDSGTASAAEIVAGALQDAHRATLVGDRTFGTGTVLRPFSLSDGSALLLATQEWLTPNGRVIWHEGITPDVMVTLPADASPLLPANEAGMTPQQVQASGDLQLLRALELLQGRQAANG